MNEQLTIKYFEERTALYHSKQRALNELLRFHVTNLSDSCNILDIGCGDGSLLFLLKSIGGFCVGVDLCKSLMKKGKASYGEHIEYVNADASHLPFREVFDVVVAVSVLHHVGGKRTQSDIVYEINRSLSEEGRFFLRELCPYNIFFATYIRWITYSGIAHCFPTLDFLTKKSLIALLKSSFNTVTILEQVQWITYRFPMGNNVCFVAYKN
jgi:ubiquinone/menaquinone biosynthesis C-methylase UbiE